MSTVTTMRMVGSRPNSPAVAMLRALAGLASSYVRLPLRRWQPFGSEIISALRLLKDVASARVCQFCWVGLIAISVGADATGQVLPAEEGEGHGRTYVILTDLAQADPYYEAVRRLQHHRAAVVVPFTVGGLGDVLELVRQHDPEFVAIVARPHTIDVNFAYDVLEFSTALDEDPFPDFAYGFITGATAADAVAFVSNIIRAERTGDLVPRRIFAFGPSNVPQVDDGHPLDWAPTWRQVRVAHEPGRFPESHRSDLTSSGIVRLWGHGSPDAVIQGLSHRDVQDVKLSPSVVFAGPCFSAVTTRFFDACRCEHDLGAREVAPARSLALSFISSGVVGYFGALAEDFCISAAQEMEHALTTGLPLGVTAKYTYDSVVMGGGGTPISLARLGAERGGAEISAAQRTLRQAASRILLGDPAYCPFTQAATPPWTTTIRQTERGLDIVAFLEDPRVRSLLVDPFRADLCDCGVRNDRLYVVVKLPTGFGGVTRISYDCSAGGLAQANHGEVQWVEERWLDSHLLHLQVDFRHGSLDSGVKGRKVVFHVQEAKSGSS